MMTHNSSTTNLMEITNKELIKIENILKDLKYSIEDIEDSLDLQKNQLYVLEKLLSDIKENIKTGII